MKIRLIFPLFFWSTFLMLLQGQNNVRAWATKGQVWVVWEFQDNPPQRINVYKSAEITTRLVDWKLIGSLYPEHAIPFPVRQHLGIPGHHYRIPDGNGGIYQLKENEGLFVETIRQDEIVNYAVVNCALADCPAIIEEDQISAVVEVYFDSTTSIHPHLQLQMDFGDQQQLWVYNFWVEGRQDHNHGLPGFPVMGNQFTNGWPQTFALWTGPNADLSQPLPAINWLHGGSGNFAQYLPGKREEINIQPNRGMVIAHHDDFYRFVQGNRVIDETNSWWFGWSKMHNPFDPNHQGPSKEDTIINYTQRRIKWTNDWLVKQGIIDSNRIAIQGYSVGSAGTIAMIKTYPDYFSSGCLFNCGHQGPDDANFGSLLLGKSDQNLATNLCDFQGQVIGIHEMYDFRRLISHDDLPIIKSWHGKLDKNPTMQWSPEFLARVTLADSTGIGYQLFWDERDHPINEIMTHWSHGPEDKNQTGKDDSKYQEQYRRDQSYPVFFNYRLYEIHHNDPGDGNRGIGMGNGDDWGSWGGYHEYDVSSIQDDVNEWSSIIYLSGVESRDLDQYNGRSDCIQADFTIRRTQRFNLAPLEEFNWKLEDRLGNIIRRGNDIADDEGRPIIRAIETCKDPNRYKITLSRIVEFGCNELTSLIPEAGTYCQTLDIQGVPRNFITLVPDGYSVDQSYGLLLAFHGGGGNMTNFAFGHINPDGGGREEFHVLAAQEDLILVYPQAMIHPDIGSTSWNTFEYADQKNTYADDFAFTEAIIQYHTSKLELDPSRIYAVGYSKGGDFAQLVGRKLSCFFAGVGSVGSSSGVTHELGDDLIQFYPKGDHAVPALMIKGDLDFKRPWNGGLNNNQNLTPSGLQDLEQWSINNNCDTQALQEEILEPGVSIRYFNNQCADGASVTMLRGLLLEHVWPDEDEQMGINANRVFIEFFRDLRHHASCLTTSMYGDRPNEQLFIYPNPASDKLSVHMKDHYFVSFRLYSSTGLLVKEAMVREVGRSMDLSISKMEAGLYILILMDDQFNYFTKKVIIK